MRALIDHDERNLQRGYLFGPHRWALVLRRCSASSPTAAPDSNTPRPLRNPRRGHRQHRHAAVHTMPVVMASTTHVRMLLTQMGVARP